MKVLCKWEGKLKFTGGAEGHSVRMDGKPPLGEDSGPSPKQLLLMAVCGCTAMDVVSLLKKFRQETSRFGLEADADVVASHPLVFSEIRLVYRLEGRIDDEYAIDAVRLSLTKYCAVSAMLHRSVPIKYEIELNGAVVGTGFASFGD